MGKQGERAPSRRYVRLSGKPCVIFGAAPNGRSAVMT
jgi:hypothetical protein